MFLGLSGFAYSAYALSNDLKQYKNLITKIESQLIPAVISLTMDVSKKNYLTDQILI